jgi:hypothetical protein
MAFIALSAVAAGQPIESLPLPGRNTVGLAWDGKAFWASVRDPLSGGLYRLQDKRWTKETRFGSTRPGPIAWAKSGLWVVEEHAQTITSYKPKTWTVTRRVPIPSGALRSYLSIAGVAWDGTHLWICQAGGLCAALVQMALDGTVLNTVFPLCEPRGLAFDAPTRALWAVAYNGPRHPQWLSRWKLGADLKSALGGPEFLQRFVASEPTAVTVAEGRAYVVDRASERILVLTAESPK